MSHKHTRRTYTINLNPPVTVELTRGEVRALAGLRYGGKWTTNGETPKPWELSHGMTQRLTRKGMVERRRNWVKLSAAGAITVLHSDFDALTQP